MERRISLHVPDSASYIEHFLSIDEVEPLTLETFGVLIQLYQSRGKRLVIAQIPPDESTTRPFYFCAHALNKVLFRKCLIRNDVDGKDTDDVDGMLLIRLHAANPLTNTLIPACVNYYLVEPNGALADTRTIRAEGAAISITQLCQRPDSLLTPTNPIRIKSHHRVNKLTASRSESDLNRKRNISKSTTSIRTMPVISKSAIVSTPSIVDIALDSSKSTSAYHATWIGTDEDFLSSSAFRQIMNDNALCSEDQSILDIAVEALIDEGIYVPNPDVRLTIQPRSVSSGWKRRRLLILVLTLSFTAVALMIVSMLVPSMDVLVRPVVTVLSVVLMGAAVYHLRSQISRQT